MKNKITYCTVSCKLCGHDIEFHYFDKTGKVLECRFFPCDCKDFDPLVIDIDKYEI